MKILAIDSVLLNMNMGRDDHLVDLAGELGHSAKARLSSRVVFQRWLLSNQTSDVSC